MNTIKRQEPLSDVWNRHITKWQRADQSQAAYCRTHDLNYHQFSYWRRKFASTDQNAQYPVRSSFVSVKADSPIPQALTVTLPNGVILKGIGADNLPLVKQLLGLHP